MSDPFKIEGPASVDVSGGRTSAYQLKKILDAHGGMLPSNVHALFSNTGKERPETLDFVRDIESNWSVRIIWLEYRLVNGEHSFEVVNHNSASRNGEPFDQAIAHRGFLPNPRNRFCTAELKIRTKERYMRSLGYAEWDAVIGIRADERNRCAGIEAASCREATCLFPMVSAGITKQEIYAEFWPKQSFDLRLQSVNNKTPEGNCNRCFLKRGVDLMADIRDNGPDPWWSEHEKKSTARKASGRVFRIDRPNYDQMHRAVRDQINIDFGDHDERRDCYCG